MMIYCNYLIYFFVFILGLMVGSFLNCIIYRLETGKSFLKGRSFCPKCKHILAWNDLIPVLSFLILRGRCRYCHQKISWQYPLVELATATLFLLLILYAMASFISIFFYIVITSFLVIIFVYDLKHFIIPDKVIYPAVVIAFLYQIISNGWREGGVQFPISITNFQFQITNFYPPILSAIGTAAFFLLIVLVSRGKWMGMGDVKLAFLMGLFLGWPNILVALFLAFFVGAIIGIGLIIFKKRTLKSEVPFGPFLVTGTFLAVFLGQSIVNWYQNLFLF